MSALEHDEGEVDLRKVEIVHEFPLNYFVENLAVRRSGGILATVANRNELLYLEPVNHPKQAYILHTFAPGTGIAGIVEVQDDIFYVSVGGLGERGTWSVFEVDVSKLHLEGHGQGQGDVLNSAAVRKVVDFPDALLLNGSALLDRSKGLILLAESFLGLVYSLNVNTAEVAVWLKHKHLAKVTDNPMMPAANGIKYHNGSVYLSNTDAKLFLRAPISKDGAVAATGEVEVVEERLGADDFIFDADGSVYLATHVYQSVMKLAADGTRTRIAGGPEDPVCAGTTAAAFGRTPSDEHSLYVTTTGGMSLPVNGKLEPARLLKILV